MTIQSNGDSANKKYSSAHPPEEPAANAFPTLDSVVTIENCHYYLSLMERFLNYKESFDTTSLKVMLARAEIRYTQWRDIVQSTFAKVNYHSFSPPLDVAYLWHVHMLSPFRYFEDSVRLSQQNVFDTHFPLKTIHQSSMNGSTEADSNESLWERYYGSDEPYTITPDNVTSGTAGLPCSFCKSIIECSWTDYAEWRYSSNVGLECRSCHKKSTVGTSSLVKLAHDMEGRSCLIAGLLLDSNGRVRNKIQAKLQATIAHCTEYEKIKHPNLRFIEPSQKFEDVINTIEAYQRNSKIAYAHRKECTNIVNAIYACYYNNPSPFSIDLIQAVGRQQDFNSKAVKEIDWQSPFGIARGIRQYHRFLQLMFTYPGQVMVPTLEIDLAWHTHMLHPSSYQAFTHKHLGRMINHDDNIAPDKLKEYSKGTDQAWSTKNGRPLINNNGSTVKLKKENFIKRIRNSFSPTFKADFNPGTLPDTSNLGVHNNDEKPKTQVSYHDRRSVKSIFGLTSSNLEKAQDAVQQKLTRSGYGYIGTVNCAAELATVSTNLTSAKATNGTSDKATNGKSPKKAPVIEKKKPKPKPVMQAPKPKTKKTSYGTGRYYGGFFAYSGCGSSSGGGGCGSSSGGGGGGCGGGGGGGGGGGCGGGGGGGGC